MSDTFILEKRVVSGGDDVEQSATGLMSLTSNDLELVDDGSSRIGQKVGIRFTGLDIPVGAVITSAYIQFQADRASTAATSLTIRADDTGDAAAFMNSKNNVSLRTLTDASAAWAPLAWTKAGEIGLAQRTPDLTGLVQEIVARSDWLPGNDLAFVITGSGMRAAESFEGGAARAPLLHVEYTLPSGTNATPALDLDSSADGTGYATVFTENNGPVPVAPASVLIVDADDTHMERMTITLTNAKTDDLLSVNGPLSDGIAVDPTSTPNKVILTGSATKEGYQTALRQITFGNSSETPDPTNRVITVTVNDGLSTSSPSVSMITINRAPDAVDDTAATVRDTPVTTGNVLANDDLGDGPTTIIAVSGTSANGGTVLDNHDGTFTYKPALGFIGQDSFTYIIADRDDDRSSATVGVKVAGTATQVFERRVSTGADDVEQSATGSVALNSSDLELVNDGASNSQMVGIRFTGTSIPTGAVITNAYIQFQTDEVGSVATSLLIRGEDVDAAGAFTTAKNSLSLLPITDASVAWAPLAWSKVDEVGLAQRTPDLSAVVQEIVDRPGWAPGNDLAFLITGSGTRTARAFESGAAKAPLLHVEWAAGEPDTTRPIVTMNSPADGATVSGVITLSAVASDNIGVKGVQFRLDSKSIGGLDTTAPYTITFDTATVGNDTVALSAVATDLSGNQATSSPVTVTIDNGSVPPPPPPPPPPSGTLRVPEDYATIQDAVNAAGNGDTILVGPGTYAGGILISGKSVTLTSHYQTAGDPSLVNQTIISGGAPAVNVAASAPNTIVEGFHFVGGNKSVQFFGNGGQALDNFFDDTGSDAVSFENVGGVARGNHFFSPGDDGVDVDAATGNIVIEDNIFEFAGDDGIEIRNQNYTGPHVTHTIRNNTITGSREDGIQIIDYSALSNRSFVIERNLIRASTDAGLGLMDNGETVEDFRAASIPERVHVFNNTFDGNTYGITGGDNLVAVNNIVSNSAVLGLKNIDASSVVSNTLFFGNGTDYVGSNVNEATSVRADPLYTSAFSLKPGSPAIDAGAVSFVYNSELVLTIPPSDYNGPTADLGWREFTL